ncbi:PHF8 [Mytilus coruscus]|uniref:PHF8 n=1 Tax=Mytilus coruscus TaxID=42192 RepID=A0A6J8CMN8_MYTCO|nr:PHF8 [Mytilus coruscus]
MIECDICRDWFHGSCVGVQEHQASDIEIYHCPNCQLTHGPLLLKKRKNFHRHDYSEDDVENKIVNKHKRETIFEISRLEAYIYSGKHCCVGVQEHQASDIEIYHCPNCQLTHGPLLLKKRKNFHRHDYSEDDVENKAVQTGTIVFIKELKNRTFPSGDEIPLLRLHGSELTPEFFNKNGLDTPILVEKKDGMGLTVPPRSFTIQDVENNVGSMREIDVIDVSKQEDCKMLMREWTEYYNSPNRAKIFNVISLEFSKTKLSELVTPPVIVRQLSWVSNLWPDQLPEDCTYTRPEVQKYCLMGVKDSFTDFHIDFGGTSVWYHVLWGEKVFYMIRPTSSNVSLYESWVSSSNQSETFFGDQVDVCYKCVVKQGQTFFIPTGWIHAVLTPIDSLVFGGNFLHDYNIPLQLQVYDIEKRVGTPQKFLFPSFETTNWYAAKHIYDLIKDYTEEGRIPPDYLVQGAKALGSHLKSWTQRKDLNNLHLFVKDAKHDLPEHVQYGRLLKELSKEVKSIENTIKSSPVKVKEKVKKKKKNNMPTPKQMVNIDLLHQHTQEKLQELQHDEKIGVYNFKDEEDENTPASLKVRIPKAGAYMEMKQEVKSDPDDLSGKSVGLKLKVSNGKIISDIGKKKSQGTKKFQPLVGDAGADEDSDVDTLVVDENPKRGKRQSTNSPSSASTMKPGSLKLKLSFHGKPMPPGTSSQESSQESERPNQPSNNKRGLNGSIADILEASGYGTETTFTVDEDVGRASPSMREAIQGMLSMSQMNEIELFSKGGKSRQHQRSQLVIDEEERLQNCYKDDEFSRFISHSCS